MNTYLPLMTQVEASDALQRHAVALLPIGTVEANGPVTPLGYDYLVAEALARRVADRTGHVALPPIPFGVSEVLSGFPGTVYVQPEHLSDQVEAVLRSMIASGWRKIVLISNHIPNQYPTEQACRRVRRETGILVPSIYPGLLAKELTTDLYEGLEHTIGHGAEPGTSIMAYLYPGSVKVDGAESNTLKQFHGMDVISPFAVRHESSQVNVYLDLDEVTDTGAWGDPTQTSADRGREIVQRIEDFIVSFVEKYANLETSKDSSEAH